VDKGAGRWEAQSRLARLPPRSASRIRTPGGLNSHRDLSCARAYPIKPRDAPSARMMIGSLPEIGDYGAEMRVSCWPFTIPCTKTALFAVAISPRAKTRFRLPRRLLVGALSIERLDTIRPIKLPERLKEHADSP
jgi:hypothetical protein